MSELSGAWIEVFLGHTTNITSRLKRLHLKHLLNEHHRPAKAWEEAPQKDDAPT